ncbi:hypothetical protein LEP1GSC173_0007 [Leptospira interrogans str. HAI1594]|uniref:Uncharacterized protein n=9 Tax=Leptospira interrogans TaxID=173 RepID=A0A0E2D190_LEPIR|nr:hypothetical protein G436_4559 [Leptospira interrogans serovar Hardjo str. Norma]EJP03546.1 hypothetical protein LEP1GSC007_2030 [Leptospira interrogans serovar Bulgarica str. Mallika]EJP15902.1 hypothetical protein LEP1GSC080_1298 [Leptospira interrogans str. FPW2026]EKO04257.1 hypothetical protein LEP1GSC077_0156 [Leptospira interrogans str. C10069]EKO98526.1 hypothetical protein LEP1GSC057_2464 [Leptospira interrogans str. Brem 329]EKP21670.1 hypothetical protein LEP1GSC117_0168 [Leptosp
MINGFQATVSVGTTANPRFYKQFLNLWELILLKKFFSTELALKRI